MKNDFSPAIHMYQTQLMSCQMIANHFNVSKVAIHKYLRKNGVDTRKRRLPTQCHQCGKTILKPRCQIRSRLHNFCSHPCYFEYIHNPNYNEHRQGQRIARRVFEDNVGFSFDWIIHHVDGNQDNNELSNLWAFKSNSEHMRYHRGGTSTALIATTGEWKEVRKE